MFMYAKTVFEKKLVKINNKFNFYVFSLILHVNRHTVNFKYQIYSKYYCGCDVLPGIPVSFLFKELLDVWQKQCL